MQINCPQSELQKRTLFVALPCYGGACAGIFARSLMDLSALAMRWGIQLQVYMLYNESLVTRARCYAADEFMRSKCTHFMFIDSDIGFNANDVISMLAMADPNSDKDVLCGPYPKKCISWEKVIQAVNKGVGDKNPSELDQFVGDFVFNPKFGGGNIPLAEPVEVLESGTGFMLIQRHVFERFKEAYPEYSYKPDHVRTAEFDGSREIMLYFQAEIDRETGENIFKDAIDKALASNDLGQVQKLLGAAKDTYENINSKISKRYLSEDYWFCQKIQKIGLKVWLCPWMKLQHFGSFTFGGSLAALASVGASATADVAQLRKGGQSPAKAKANNKAKSKKGAKV